MNSELSFKIIELSKNDDQGEKVVKYLEGLLSKDPTNIDLWLRLAIIEIKVPRVDYDKSFACLDRVFELDKENLIALLCLAYSYHIELGGVTEAIFNKLNAIITDSDELNSMIAYAKSWYYEGVGDEEQVENFLKESIRFYGGHVWSYVNLAQIYIAKNRKNEARGLVQKALNNIVKVYTMENLATDYDPTDVDEYINGYIKGIYMTDINLEGIKELLIKAST